MGLDSLQKQENGNKIAEFVKKKVGKKIFLSALIKHSKMVKEIKVLNGMVTFKIVPWGAVEVEELQPLLSRLVEDFKVFLTARKENNETDLWTAIAAFLKRDEISKITFDVVYRSLEKGNETVMVIDPSTEQEVEAEFFEKEELKAWLPVDEYIPIISAILDINFKRNPILARAEEKTATPTEKNQVALATEN